MHRMIPTLLLTLTLSACGDDDKGPPTDHEGAYAIATWTLNDQGCDTEGASVLGNTAETHILVYVGNFIVDYVGAALCEGTGCDTENLFGDYIFSDGDDKGGWEGEQTSGYVDVNDTCQGRATFHIMTFPTSSKVRIESRSHEVSGAKIDGDGFCDLDDVRAKAKSQPCTELEVLTGATE